MRSKWSVMKGGMALTAVLGMALALPSGAADLPSVDDVIAKYVKAVGGKDAIGKVKTRVMKGKFSLPDMGMEAPMEIYLQPPNMYNMVNVEAMGIVIEFGVSGDVVWQVNPMEGNSIVEGAQKGELLRQASLEPLAEWKKHYEKAEVAEETTVNDKKAYKVVFTPKDGDPQTMFFDAESGLIVQTEAIQDGMPVTTAVEEYKEFDGVKIPTKMTSSGGMMNPVITFSEIEQNVEIPAEKFALPDEIKALQN